MARSANRFVEAAAARPTATTASPTRADTHKRPAQPHVPGPARRGPRGERRRLQRRRQPVDRTRRHILPVHVHCTAGGGYQNAAS